MLPASAAPRQILRRRRPRIASLSGRIGRLGAGSLCALGVVAATVVVSPWVAPFDPASVASVPLSPPGDGHLLGTDQQGRDLLARVSDGARTSLLSALAVIAAGLVIGGVVGLAAGVSGGFVDACLMRLTDLFLALPGPLLVLAVVAALGPSLRNTLIALAAVWWPWYARIVRGVTRATVRMPFVEAARLAGLGRVRVAIRHVLPAAFGPAIVTASLDVGNLILLLAALSFLGLGSPEPAAELGAMTAQGLPYLFTSWWVAVIPAAAVFVLAAVSNLAGDAVSDLLPR